MCSSSSKAATKSFWLIICWLVQFDSSFQFSTQRKNNNKNGKERKKSDLIFSYQMVAEVYVCHMRGDPYSAMHYVVYSVCLSVSCLVVLLSPPISTAMDKMFRFWVQPPSIVGGCLLHSITCRIKLFS